MKPRLACAAAPLLAVLLSPPATAAGATPSRVPPTLVRTPVAWAVERGGREQALALPADVAPERVTALGDGWLLTGRRESEERSEIFLLADSGRGPAEIAPPGDPAGRVREGATAVVAGDRLVGLAWLEGDERRSYAVRWAPWSGSGFGAPVEIAARGPGSQLALAAARLADGRVVLVWSGFDGLDDEIWASLGAADAGAKWSRPARVGADNAVPDVTPDVAAVGDGALVAWSRFDGAEYRVRLARLTGDHFEELDAEGPAGSLYPTFAGVEPRPRLLWRDARADEWTVAELTPAGALVTRARAAGPVDERPTVAVEGGQAWFRFGARRVATDWR